MNDEVHWHKGDGKSACGRRDTVGTSNPADISCKLCLRTRIVRVMPNAGTTDYLKGLK